MGKFDGYLICSDLDGTFDGKGDTVEVNKRAVKYFTDNGGKFTFITGRTASYLMETDYINIANAPMGVLNGGIIYDFQNEKLLRESRLEFKLGEFAELADCGKFDIQALGIYNECFGAWERKEKFSDYSYLFNSHLIKIHCIFKTPEEADEFKEFAKNHEFFKNTFISKSWHLGVEFNAADATKGDVIQFLKNHFENIHTSVGIGDFENDIKLLEYADIGVATGNAIDEVKQTADLVVKDCKEYAIKDLIEILESRL